MTLRREFMLGDDVVRAQAQHLHGDVHVVHVGDRRHEVEAQRMPDGRWRLSCDGRVLTAAVAAVGKDLHVRVGGRTWVLQPFRGRASRSEHGSGTIMAPMTGTVLQVLVQPGDVVTQGQKLVVLTAMKMEHKLVAPRDGTVAEVLAEAGATVDQGALLVRLD